MKKKNSDQTNKHERERNPLYKQDCVLYLCQQRQPANQESVFETRDHHIAKWTFTSQDHQLTKISPILQAWFLYSVNIDKYDT